jgi:beta-glucosidase
MPTASRPLAAALSLAAAAATAAAAASAPPQYPFNDSSLPAAQRAADLLARLTLHEKVGMLFMDASMAYGNDTLPKGGDLPSTGVPRLGVPQFNWMSQGNAYRGASNGCTLNCCTSCSTSTAASPCCSEGASTQLPQGTGVAATWNADLVFAAGAAVGDESRGYANGFPGGAQLADYRTGASSVINILRDGRWGRAPETYGECPVLTGEIAVAFNKGLMGFAQRNATSRPSEAIKVLPVVRHFVAYAGPDSSRFSFNAEVSEDDLRLTFLPAWRRRAAEGALRGGLIAISALNSIPSAAHKSLLTGMLRGEWGWDGFVISDCDTISAISEDFHFTSSVEQAAAAALQAGGDLNCG